MGLLSSVKAPAMRLSDIPEAKSFPEIAAATEQYSAALERARKCEAKLQSIREASGKTSASASVQTRAEASLRGEAVKISTPSREELARVLEEKEVLDAAVSLARKALEDAIANASVEICRQLAAEHHARVKEVVTRAIALHEAKDAESEVSQAIRAKGFVVLHPIAEFPQLGIFLGRPSDPNSLLARYISAVRSKGVEV